MKARHAGPSGGLRARANYDIRPADRAWVYKRDNHRCLKCNSDETLTVDHILPRALGGADHRSNYQTLCARCNSSKGATFADYRPDSDAQLTLALQPPRPSLRDRFMEKVSKQNDGCWYWTGALINGITPAMNVHGTTTSAAQVSCRIAGKQASGKVYRSCRKTICVNPDHLSAERAASYVGSADECRNGHRGDFVAGTDGSRRCRTCRRASQNAWYAQKKEQALAS